MLTRDLSPELIEEVATFEHANMGPVWEKAGVKCSLNYLQQCLRESQSFIIAQKNAEIRGLVRIEHVSPEILYVMSIQIKEGCLWAFKQLLSDGVSFLGSERAHRIVSDVYPSNTSSLKLHRKLGFEVVSESPKLIRLQASRAELIETMRKFLR